MRIFYYILWWLSSFHLAIALNAPVRNSKHIEALRADVARWERAMEDTDIRARFG